MVDKLLDRVFEGSAHQLAAHLVEAGKLTSEELAELQSLIAQNQLRRSSQGGK